MVFSAVSCIDSLFIAAAQSHASDIHIHIEPDHYALFLRIDGQVVPHEIIRDAQRYQIIARLKALAQLDVVQRRQAQDGAFTYTAKSIGIDVRIAILPAQWGEAVSLRLFYSKDRHPSLVELGMPVALREILLPIAVRPYGLLLFTGPTGSGKSTTLRSFVGAIDQSKFRIVSLEDPIEYVLPGVTQCHIAPDIGFTFSQGLRAVLRQDPDVLIIGEIRDAATAQIAVQAALTGHLVVSSMHTQDSITALARLIDMQIPVFLLQASMRLLVAQRLVRKKCLQCAENRVDCSRCKGTGWHGRHGIFEYLQSTDTLWNHLRQQGCVDELRSIIGPPAYYSLCRAGAVAVEEKITSAAEIETVCSW